jgi:hypothetical protein
MYYICDGGVRFRPLKDFVEQYFIHHQYMWPMGHGCGPRFQSRIDIRLLGRLQNWNAGSFCRETAPDEPLILVSGATHPSIIELLMTSPPLNLHKWFPQPTWHLNWNGTIYRYRRVKGSNPSPPGLAAVKRSCFSMAACAIAGSTIEWKLGVGLMFPLVSGCQGVQRKYI